MAKSVYLKTGRSFGTAKAAKEYFSKILNSRDINQEFSIDDSADVLAVYEEYCAKTNWELKSYPKSFYPAYDRGVGYTTRCFGVTFENGTTGNFSMDKALRAIAV